MNGHREAHSDSDMSRAVASPSRSSSSPVERGTSLHAHQARALDRPAAAAACARATFSRAIKSIKSGRVRTTNRPAPRHLPPNTTTPARPLVVACIDQRKRRHTRSTKKRRNTHATIFGVNNFHLFTSRA